MRCFCACIMQLCHCLFIPCYIYNENCICIHTHAYLSMHHLDIHIKVHTNSKSNILIQAYMDITSHYHPGNDTHKSLGLVMTQFVHDQPPTSHVMASIMYNYVSFICHTMTHEPLDHIIHFPTITHKIYESYGLRKWKWLIAFHMHWGTLEQYE